MGHMFGDKIKLAREEKGLTQEQAAANVREKYNVRLSAAYLSMIERNERTNLTKNVETALKDFYDLSEDIVNVSTNSYKPESTKKKIASAINVIRDFLGSENGDISSSLSLPSMLNLLSIVSGTGPIHPKLELADILEERDIQITSGGEPLDVKKRQRLIQAIKGFTGKIPVLGTIIAGIPVLSEQQNIVEYLDSTPDLEGKVDFGLIVRGDSMIGAGISDGDIVLCKQNYNHCHGDVVVALVNLDETTLKYYIKENGKAVLRAANPDPKYKDIELKDNDQIQGHVVRILKNPPSLNTYREYIYIKDDHLQGWNEAIEKAVSNGFKPSAICNMIDMQIDLAKKLSGMS